MRTKSEAKRRDIVRIAAQAFEVLGYERASMSAIAERVGGSKQTLYNYFPSKEELLRAVLHAGVQESAETARAEFEAGARTDLRTALVRTGVAFLRDALSPSRMALIRTVANLPAEMNLGRAFYESAIRPAWQGLAQTLEGLMDEGKLARADPWVASLQFKALNELDLHERLLLGVDVPGRKEIKRTAESAADAFLRLYGVGDAR